MTIDINELVENVRRDLGDLLEDVAKNQKQLQAQAEDLRKNVGPEPGPEEWSGAGPEGEGSAAAGAPASDAGAVGFDDVEQLVEMYLAMPPEELVMHYKAAKTAIFILMEEEEATAAGAGGPGAGSPEASPGPGRGTGPEPGGDLGKAQVPANASNGGKVRAGSYLGKGEELERLLAHQGKQIEDLTKAFELIVGKPQRRAVTGMDYLAKSQAAPVRLTRDQILAKLTEVAATDDLKKSDREKINAYVMGSLDLSAVQHLIVDK